MISIRDLGAGAETPSEVELALHLDAGTISPALQADMAEKGYDAAKLVSVADRARAEGAAISILDTFYLGLAAVGAEKFELANESLRRVADNGGIFADEAQELLERLSAE